MTETTFEETVIRTGIWHRIGRGFSYSFLGQIAQYGVTFLLAPIYARALLPAEYGTISLANSVRGILVLLMPMSTAGAVTYWYNLHRTEPAEQRKAVGSIAGLGIATATGWLVICLAAGSALQHYAFPDFPLSFWPYGALVIVSAWLMSLQGTPMTVLASAERQGTRAGVSLALGVVQMLIIIALVVGMRRGARGQIEAMALSATVALPVFVWLLWRYSPPRVGPQWREIVLYSIPLLPHQLSVWALNLSDRMIIGHYGSRYAVDLGLYSFAYAIATVMQAVLAAFSSIWSPVYLEQARNNPEAQRDLGRTASWSIVILAFCAGVLMTFSAEAIAIIGGARYSASVQYVAPVVFAYFMQAVYMFPAMALYHVKKTSRLPAVTLISAGVNIAINLALIPIFGVVVAAWATAIGFTVMAVLGFVAGHRPFPLHYRAWPVCLGAVIVAVGFGLARIPFSAAGLLVKIGVIAALSAIAFALWKSEQRHELTS